MILLLSLFFSLAEIRPAQAQPAHTHTTTISRIDFSALRELAGGNLNCVNPGGSCDGSLPCCGQNNYCIDRVCRPYPLSIDATAPSSPGCGDSANATQTQ